MFISATINEITREIKWDKSQVAAVDGDYAVNGFKITCLGLDPDYNLTTGAWYAVFTAQDGTSHSNPLTVSDGVVTWEFDNNINKGGAGVIKFFLYAVTANTTGKILKRWDSAITDLRVAGTIDYENQEEEAARESEIDRLAGLVTTLTATAATINDVKAVISRITNSSPVVVAAVADLSGLDTTKYQLAIVRADGYLYYYDGAAWQKGIKYGSYELDTTLTESGKAADAAAVGAEVSAIKEDLSQNRTRIALSNPWEIGTFDPYNGAQRDNVYRLRNTQYIGFEFGDLRAICYNGLEFTLVAWDENETYIGMYANGSFSKSGGSFVETFDFSNFKNYHFMPLLRRKDSSAVETTDGLNFLLARHNTDQTLSQIGKNADAKITGDKIRAIEERIETDKTLTKHKRPADAKTVGDELDLIKEGYSLNDNIKDALLTIASNIAYTNTNGQIYYNVLRDALYPPQKGGYKYNPSNVVTGAYIDETGNIVTAGASSGYDDVFINISYAKELTILYTAPSVNNVNFRVSIYDSGLNFVRQIHYEVARQKYGIVTINFGENEKFIKLGWYSGNTSIDPLSDIAFYLSSAADEMIMDIGSISVTTGEEESDSRRLCSTFISAKNDLTVIGYPFGSVEAESGWVARCYDSSYAYISSVPDGKLQSGKAVFNTTLPEGTAFIRFVYQNSPNAYTQGWSENVVGDFWVNGHRYRFEEE